MARSPFVLVVGVVLTWFIAAFLVWPNVNVLIARPSSRTGAFPAAPRRSCSPHQRAMKALGNSFLLAVALSVTVNLVGIFIVLVTQYFRIRGSRILFLGYASTFIYGGIVLAAGYKFIYGDKGIVTSAAGQADPRTGPRLVLRVFRRPGGHDLRHHHQPHAVRRQRPQGDRLPDHRGGTESSAPRRGPSFGGSSSRCSSPRCSP